jgi:hypothetical protein
MQCSQGKIQYPNRAAAHRAADAAGYRNIRTYEHDGHWHFCRGALKVFHHETAPKTTGPAPYTPSAAKLRRKLNEAAAQIRHCEKAIAKSEAKKARQEMLEAARRKTMELTYESELQAIAEMIGRLQRQ